LECGWRAKSSELPWWWCWPPSKHVGMQFDFIRIFKIFIYAYCWNSFKTNDLIEMHGTSNFLKEYDVNGIWQR
jgi:hypothetical protein